MENVVFRDVVLNGRPLTAADVKSNGFVRNVARMKMPKSMNIFRQSNTEKTSAPVCRSVVRMIIGTRSLFLLGHDKIHKQHSIVTARWNTLCLFSSEVRE